MVRLPVAIGRSHTHTRIGSSAFTGSRGRPTESADSGNPRFSVVPRTGSGDVGVNQLVAPTTTARVAGRPPGPEGKHTRPSWGTRSPPPRSGAALARFTARVVQQRRNLSTPGHGQWPWNPTSCERTSDAITHSITPARDRTGGGLQTLPGVRARLLPPDFRWSYPRGFIPKTGVRSERYRGACRRFHAGVRPHGNSAQALWW